MFSVLAALVIAACGGGSDSQVFGSSGGGGVCTPATFRCTGDDLERCTDDGKGYAKVVTCPVKGLCDAMGGQCDVCKPGSGTCVDGSNIAACSADGQKVENKACDAATPFCASSDFGDHCVGCTKSEDCAASANECAVALCGKDGTCATQPIAKDTPCGAPGAGGKCDGAGKCVSCIDGEKKCDGAVPSLCTAGSWIALPACSGDKAVCNAGECVACAQPSDCAPSANECLSASCSAQHSCGFSAKAQNSICMGGAGKCDGAGQCDVCQPGTKVCNGDAVLACGNNGQYGALVACGGATPKCDPQSAACVACYDGSQCPQSGNACLQAACTSNQCGFVPKAQGAACPGGTCNGAGQCYVCQPGSTVCSGNQVLTCNAMGQYDAPLVCSGGTPYCDPQSPSCVQCVSAANCPASGSSCITATCNGNACGFANAPNGTACMVGSDAGSCSSGACNVCANGTTRCKAGANDVPQLCVSGGWVDQAACGAPLVCASGACVSSSVMNILPAYNAKLRGYWKFDGNFVDSSGAGNNANAKGSASLAAGKYGQAASFNGTTAYLDFSGSVINVTTNISISSWVNPSVNHNTSIYGFGPKDGCDPSSSHISLHNGSVRSYVGCSAVQPLGGSVPNNMWTHVVFTRDASNKVTLYVNGAMVAGPVDDTAGHSLSIGNDTIGAHWGGNILGSFYAGLIDEMVVWSGVTLSAAEVATLYSQSK